MFQISEIYLQNLSKSFSDVEVIKDVDLQINDQEFLTILGPSGSGKTTLLTLIAGFESPTHGSIYIGGKNVDNLPPNRRNIGLVFQNYALFPHMTVFDNVAFPLKIRKHKKDEIDNRVRRMLQLVQLENFENRKINELSGGQQQRVALARAISFNPDILLLDEPLAALDRKLRQAVQIELKELQRSLGITTINVTHDQEEALIMSDRILILNHGRVEQIGTPEELYECPENRFVAQFLGSANLFEAKVVEENGDKIIQIEGGGRVTSRNIKDIAVGTVGTLMIRPNKISLSSSVSKKVGGIRSTIKSVNYLGGQSRYELQTVNGNLVNVIDSKQFAKGDNVLMNWETNDSWFISEATHVSDEELINN